MALFENFSHPCNLSSSEAKSDTKHFNLAFDFTDASDADCKTILVKQLVIEWQQRNRSRLDELEDGSTVTIAVETLAGKRPRNAARHAKSVLDSMTTEALAKYIENRNA